MPKLIALWSKPADPEGFDADYEATHRGLCEKVPGVRAEFGKVLQGDYHRVAILSFDSMEALGAGLGGAEGGALMQDAGRLQEQFGNTVATVLVD